MTEKLLIILIDAFRYDYLNEFRTPFLFELAKKNCCAKLESVLGYSDTVKRSILTGTYPEENGIWSEFVYSKKKAQRWIKFLPLDRFPHMINAPLRFLISSIFNINLRNIPVNLLRYFEEAEENKRIVTLYRLLSDNSINYIDYEESSFNIFRRGIPRTIKKTDTDLVFYKIPDLDLQGHIWGVNSHSTHKKISAVDKHVKNILNFFKRLWNNKFNVIVMSDHGMVEVKQYINLAGYIRRLFKEEEDFIAFYDATLARFWFKDQVVKEKLSAILKQMKIGRILNDKELKRYGVYFSDRRYGELIFLLEPGYLIFPNFYEVLPFPPRGMHGYAPEIPGMLGMFICPFDLKSNYLKVIKVFSIILDLLNIHNC